MATSEAAENEKQRAVDRMLQEIKRKISNVTRTFHKCRKDCNKLNKKIKIAQEKINFWRHECAVTERKIFQIRKQEDYHRKKPNAELKKLIECRRKLRILMRDEIKFVDSLRAKLEGMLEAKNKLEKRLSYLAFKRDNMLIRFNKNKSL